MKGNFMNYTLVKDLYKSAESFFNKDVNIGGWVRTLRTSKIPF